MIRQIYILDSKPLHRMRELPMRERERERVRVKQ